MSYVYRPFPLDDWVSKFYRSIGVNEPADINIKHISRSLRIYISYSEHRCFSREEGRFKMINLNKNMDLIKQREIYFHELCHILRHEGYQFKMMPAAFKELQERDAHNFVKYAAVPFHMLKYLDWKSDSLVKDMSEVFKVSEELCQYRIDHIYRNAKEKQAYNTVKE